MATATQPPVIDRTVAPDEPSMSDVLALLQKMERDNEALREEVRQSKSQQSQFRPMIAPSGVKPKRGGVWSALNDQLASMPGRRGWGEREAQGVSGQVLIDIHGEKIPDQMLDKIGPRYFAGDQVRINPESAREGFAEGLTWATILGRTPANPDGIGTVTKILWLTDREWKYKVRVPGISGLNADGFHDSELLPA